MGLSKINLDSIVSYYIHRPILQGKNLDDLPPLYARTGLESESTFDSEGLKNPIWQEKSKHTYNSPTNIRRLFIGDHKVYIQYYQPYISNDISSGKYWVEYKYSEKDDIGNLVKRATGGDPDNPVQLTKTGLGALSSHWKVSNIEELFITPSILLSYDVIQMFPNALQLFKTIMQCKPGSLVKDETLLKIFETVNGSNISNIRARFPRLRTLGFVVNLESIMEAPGIKSLKEGLPETLSNITENWVVHAVGLGAHKSGICVICEVPYNKSKPLVDFSVRPGIYKFDADVLVNYTEKYKNRVLEIGRQQRDKNLSTQVQNECSKSEFEVYLDELMIKYSENIVRDVIRLGLSTSKKEEIDKEFSSMTKEGREKYRALFGR